MYPEASKTLLKEHYRCNPKIIGFCSEIEADTVHKYQGREKDIIILTTVSNQVNDFIDNTNLINVAVSRAVDKLILVVSGNEQKQKSIRL